jgi:outer membrane protein TolC
MQGPTGIIRAATITATALVCAALCRCKSPGAYRAEADEAAYSIIESHQQDALGRTEPFTIERPQDTLRRRLLVGQELPYATAASLSTKDIQPIEQWPDDDYLSRPDPDGSEPPWTVSGTLQVTLADALRIGARNSRDYQTRKEQVFQAALALDLERWEFRNQWAGLLAGDASADLAPEDDEAGVTSTGELALLRRFETGMTFLGRIGFDLAQLLTGDSSSSLGLFADATVTIPLMRGSGRFVVTEPLTQADRDVVYAIYDFEQFKRDFAVQVATDYLSVLQLLDELRNNEENYRWLIAETARARRMAATGRLPEFQVDQARQDELDARNQWIESLQEHDRRLDAFKELLGLAPDADVVLDEQELRRLVLESATFLPASAAGGTPDSADQAQRPQRLQEQEQEALEQPVELRPPSREGGGPREIEPTRAVILALLNRPDLRTAIGRIYDAQRTVAVAADQLRADLTLLGRGSIGARRRLADADLPDADLRFDEGAYSVLLNLNLPLYRIPERNVYRNSLIALEQAVRNAQAVEDRIKLDVREDLRTLVESRERLIVQAEAVDLARRRVQSTQLFLRAGRAEIRDVLEAQSDLLDARNSLSFEVVQYRVSDLSLQRDMGMLEVSETGLWTEFVPPEPQPLDG